MIVFALGSFQYGSGIISSLLLALSPLNAVESMAVMMFAGTALFGAHGVVAIAQPERSLSWD
ncbi:Uncharacterised protein [Mycobacterium tuberculosis]|nr:Uncharacterised protein [Mycobacterium tuberculosis]CNI39056.1 Uncharacterised protein [Mycobacterium tuberculosis]